MSLDPLELAERDAALDAAEAAARVPDARPRGRAAEPFATLDRTGMPAVQDLGRLEANAFRRLSPRRNRWPALVEIDARVADLERRQGEAGQRVRDLHEQLANAPVADADRLASWELDGRKAARPQPSRPALELAIGEAEAEVAGLEVAVGRELEVKAAYVDRHRSRLVKDADKATSEAHERLLALVDELEAARGALVELRTSATWAALFPAAEASRGPRESLLAGGLAKPVKDCLGIDIAFEVARVLRVLRADADFWRNAATPEQRGAMEGCTDADRAGGAAWTGTPEGVELERGEKAAARKRYETIWGSPPDGAA